MNFIDISNWQAGIDLETLFANNPLDGVIIKATEATGYTNPQFSGWAEWLTSNNKPWGAYHFLSGGDAIAEAEFFYNVTKNYIGHFVPCADYEADALKRGTGWLKDFLDEYERLSGVKCLVYCSQSVTQAQNFNDIARAGYQLWMAQYADYSPVYGFLDNPWHKGSVGPFVGYVMQQYTSCGVLKGWSRYLDFDKFFGNADDWNALCGKANPTHELKPADPAVVADVLAGRYGTENDNPPRSERLIKAGYDPESVQNKINDLYYCAIKIKPIVKGNMEYLNSIVYILRT